MRTFKLMIATLLVVSLSACGGNTEQSRLGQLFSHDKPAAAATAPDPVQANVTDAKTPYGAIDRSTAPGGSNGIPDDNMALEGTLAQAGTNNPLAKGGVDYDTFTYPVTNAKTNPDGYPIYLISCDEQGQCIGWGNKPIGTINDVAASITNIRNKDVVGHGYTCDKLCTDADGHIVGAPSEAMIAWLEEHPQFAKL